MIGLQVFEKKVPPVVINNYNYPWNHHEYWPKNPTPYWDSGIRYGSNPQVTYTAADTKSVSSIVRGINTMKSTPVPPYQGYLSAGAATMDMYNASDVVATATLSASPSVPTFASSVGTEFGDAATFKTRTVNFERQATAAYKHVIYYGSSKDLNALGIVLNWQKPKVQAKPNPFPGDFCTPPAGWVNKTVH